MYKNIFYLSIAVAFMSLLLFGMDISETAQTPAPTSHTLDTEKAAIEKGIKKNKSELQSIQKNTILAVGLAIIEPKLQKIIASSEFQSTIDKMASKEAQDIQQGQTFESVKYSHSLAQDFPKLNNPNKLLARAYSLMANIAHYELVLSKLANPEQSPSSEQKEQAKQPEAATNEPTALTEFASDQTENS